MIATENFAQVEISAIEELLDWLATHHGREDSVWLITHKKSTPEKYVSRDEVLDALIAFGWIDGVRRKLDEMRTMQLISPRRQKAWAKTYKDRAARLEAEGKMQDPGRRAIAEAKASGLWSASEDVDALIVPPDLQAALDAHPHAAGRFAGFAPSYIRNVLRWLNLAKTTATREKRLKEIAARAARGEKVPQF